MGGSWGGKHVACILCCHALLNQLPDLKAKLWPLNLEALTPSGRAHFRTLPIPEVMPPKKQKPKRGGVVKKGAAQKAQHAKKGHGVPVNTWADVSDFKGESDDDMDTMIDRQTGERRRPFAFKELDPRFYRMGKATFTVPRAIAGNRALVVMQNPGDLFHQQIQTVDLSVGENGEP